MVLTRLKRHKAAKQICWAIRAFSKIRDPILLTAIRQPFVLVRNKTTYLYDVSSLVSYILASGDYADPIARIEYNSCELMRLDHRIGNPPRFLEKNKHHLQFQKEAQLAHEGLCNVFEQDIMHILQHQAETLEEDDSEFLNIVTIPGILTTYENYRLHDQDRCRIFFQSLWRHMIRSPWTSRKEAHYKIVHVLFGIFLIG